MKYWMGSGRCRVPTRGDGPWREAAASNKAKVLSERVSPSVAATESHDGLDHYDWERDTARSRASQKMSSGLAATGSDRAEP